MMRRYVAAYGLWLAAVLAAAGVALYYYRRVLAIGEAELAEHNGAGPMVPARRREPEPEPELVEPPVQSAGADGSELGAGAIDEGA